MGNAYLEAVTGIDKLGNESAKAGEKVSDIGKKAPKPGLFSGLKTGVKEFGKEGEKAGKNIVKSLGPIALIGGVITSIVLKIKEMVGANAQASAAFEKMGDVIETLLKPPLDFIVGLLTKAAEGVTWLMDKITGGASMAQVAQNKLNAEINATEISARNAGNEYQKAQEKTNALVKAGIISQEEAAAQNNASAKAYKAAEARNALTLELYDSIVDISNASDKSMDSLMGQIRIQKMLGAATKEEALEILKALEMEKEKTSLQQLEIDLGKLAASYRETEARAQLNLNAGIITQKEYEEIILAASVAHNGGIVDTPTTFPMSNGATGLMGEAGPEGIFPLTRTPNGDLGINAVGAGGPQSINVNLILDGTVIAQTTVDPVNRGQVGLISEDYVGAA